MEQDLATPLVDAANAIFGSHPRTRALHAKGTWIELSDDPILHMRPRAYSVSIERRSG